MPLKAVLFDFDGTLGNTLSLCLRAAHLALEPILGRKITDEEILAAFGPSEEGAIRNIVPPEIYQNSLNAYVKMCRDLLPEYPDLFPGIREILLELKQRGIILGLVTGRGRITCDDALKFYGIFDWFDQIEGGIETGPSKPAGLNRILKNFVLKPEETVYVGDSTCDILACREVGIPVIAVAWAPTANPAQLADEAPDELFHSVSELHEWLRRNLPQMDSSFEHDRPT